MRTALATLALASTLLAAACGGGSATSVTPTATTRTTPSPGATKSASTSTPVAASATPAAATATAIPATAAPPPSPAATVGAPPPAPTEPPAPPPPPPAAGGGTLTIAAVNVLFDKESLSATAGPITIVFTNQDTAVAHNIQFFAGSTSIGMTEINTGPATDSLSLGTLAPGSYFYKCDVHPTTMNGSLTVS